MPDADDDDYRVVIDEGSLDLRQLPKDEVHRVLGRFGDILELLADGRQVAFMESAYAVECLPSLTFADLATCIPHPAVPRDERVRLAKLLDKCRRRTEEDLPQSIRIDGGSWQEASWGMAHALRHAAHGRAMSCLVLSAPAGPSGWVTVEQQTGSVRLHVLRDPQDVAGFWREIYLCEGIAEEQFFTLADQAFPRLAFYPELDFRRFKGSYPDVVPWLVKLLGAVNDHFSDALEQHGGDQKQVVARFDSLGLDISPESGNTRKNAKAWAQRLVLYRGVEYRCEWHGKRLWNLDRVHFSLPIAAHDGRILIGIFVDHLAT